MFGEKFNKPFYLSFRMRERHGYSEYTPSNIKSETDLLWGTTDGFNDAGFQIPDLFFDQKLFDGRLDLNYGQFSIDKFVDKHALRSAKRFFLNQAFSDNPTVGFPSFGAGFAAKWKPNESWEFGGGGSNIQGVEGDSKVDFKLDSSALFGTVQIAYNFTGIGSRSGRLQAMGWGIDGNDEENYTSGNGLSFTLEHSGKIKGESFVLRYAQSDGEATSTDLLWFLGYGREIRGFDNLGAGVGAGRSSATTKWQAVFELYYRWQVTKELLLTPDVQFIFGDDLDGDRKTRIVAGLRAGLVF
jgi:porin